MTLKKIMIFFAATSLLLAAGCATSTNLQRQNSQLQREIRDLKEQLKLQNLKMERQVNQTRANLPEMRLELDRMRSELQRLINSVETAEQGGGQRLSLKEQLGYLNARLDRLETRLRLPPLNPKLVGGNVPVNDGEADDGLQAATAEGVEFAAAQNLFNNKDYVGALEGFRAFVSKYPDSSYTPSAQFYVGECFYNQKKYEEAILEYQKVIKQFPKSNKVSIALLRQGLSFISIGDATSGKLLLQKIVREHPNSYAARAAREKLKTL